MILAEKVQDDGQVAPAVVIIVYQQNLGFTPHLVYRALKKLKESLRSHPWKNGDHTDGRWNVD
jgi:hypothetical protein